MRVISVEGAVPRSTCIDEFYNNKEQKKKANQEGSKQLVTNPGLPRKYLFDGRSGTGTWSMRRKIYFLR